MHGRQPRCLAVVVIDSLCSCAESSGVKPFVDKIRLGNFLKIHIRPPLVYRLQDGSFHRVIAANLLDPAVIVRIPRFEYGPPLADQVAILFLHS
jgi:hypothetical protein